MGKLGSISIVLFLSLKMAFSQDLADYQWKNRLLILVTETGSTEAEEQKKTFAKFKKEFKERDLLLLESQLDNEELIKRFNISETFEGVLLIGKDGGLKLKSPFSVKAENIFRLIDSMPMRRAEMKKS